MSYWLRCASSVMTMMSLRVRELGENLAPRRAEFLDQGEDVALVAAQKLLQMLAALRLHRLAQLRQFAAGGEGPGDLAVEFGAVGDDEKGPVARLLAQNLAGEEQHRQALARALRVPEDAEPALVLGDVVDRLQRAIDAEQLVGLRQLLDQAELALLEGDEILDKVEKPRRPARALDQRIEADGAGLLLVVDPLPFVEELERRIGRAEHRVEPVRQDDEGVRREHLRNGRAVVGEIAVVRRRPSPCGSP